MNGEVDYAGATADVLPEAPSRTELPTDSK
jgi:hypothetical protein